VQSRNELAVIVGAGSGLSASLARKCAAAQMRVALAARNIGKLQPLAHETGASVHACDAADAAQVDALFGGLEAPDLVVYNPSYRIRGPFLGLGVQRGADDGRRHGARQPAAHRLRELAMLTGDA